MKTMRKALALIMALAIVMSLGITAFATETTHTITIKNPANSNVSISNQTFTAYQVFTVTVNNGKYNYDVAPGFDDFTFDVNTGTTDGPAKKSGEELISSLENLGNNTEVMHKFAAAALAHAKTKGEAVTKSSATAGARAQKVAITVPGLGYYVIDGPATRVDNSEATTVIASLVTAESKTTEIVLKAQAPTLDKKAKDITDNPDGDYTDDVTAAVGSTVEFQLNAVVPNMNGYNTYNYTFHDVVTDGLSINQDSIKVYVKNTAAPLDSSSYQVTWNTANKEFTLSMDMKAAVQAQSATIGDPVVVTYQAKVTADALTRQDSSNEAYLEYSNDPTDQEGGTPGETPKDIVRVYNVDVNVVKLDGADQNKLADAEFVLYRTADNGKDTNDKNYYYYNSAKVNWTAGTGTTVPDSNVTVGKSVAGTGLIDVFKGLPAGTYFLKETKAPDGYNAIKEPIEIVIEPVTGEDEVIDSINVKIKNHNDVSPEYATNTYPVGEDHASANILHSVNVENRTGAKLPETGGIGTTIFYTVGGILMVTALALFITKKKMSVN